MTKEPTPDEDEIWRMDQKDGKDGSFAFTDSDQLNHDGENHFEDLEDESVLYSDIDANNCFPVNKENIEKNDTDVVSQGQ